MILGKITVEVENIYGTKNYFCRPVANGQGEVHPRIVGVCQVVSLKKCSLSSGLHRGQEFTTYAIFNRRHSIDDFRRGYTKVEASPITEEIYNQLIEIYPQSPHAFSC